MRALYCVLLPLLLALAPATVTVSGRIVDRSGKPAVNATVAYANAAARRNYTGRTDAKGQFEIAGVAPGSYEITITDQGGMKVFSGKTDVWRGADDKPNVVSPDNFLTVDLSKAPAPGGGPGATGSTAQSQMNAPTAELLREKNANALKSNQLITALHAQLGARDWAHAIETLQQLIALYPDRWEFYQNLGASQTNLMHYEEAAKSYAKGVEVAQKTMSSASEPAKATDIGGMMLSEADAYSQIGKLDQAMALYNEAAQLFPQPAQVYYRVCSAQSSHGNAAATIEACNQAITADPNQWQPYQLLAGAQIMLHKNQEALQTYDKGIDIARKGLATKPDSPETRNGVGLMLTAKGSLYTQMERYDEAIASFSDAATASVNPALPEYNLCALFYKKGRIEDAITACNKAIAADPGMADAYYVKGSVLFSLGRLEYGKYVVPPQTRESLNKYLEITPSGPHAEAVRGMLDKLGPELDASKKHKKKH
jgi:tetratricopeptide (TPR) repeat protein